MVNVSSERTQILPAPSVLPSVLERLFNAQNVGSLVCSAWTVSGGVRRGGQISSIERGKNMILRGGDIQYWYRDRIIEGKNYYFLMESAGVGYNFFMQDW